MSPISVLLVCMLVVAVPVAWAGGKPPPPPPPPSTSVYYEGSLPFCVSGADNDIVFYTSPTHSSESVDVTLRVMSADGAECNDGWCTANYPSLSTNSNGRVTVAADYYQITAVYVKLVFSGATFEKSWYSANWPDC